MTNPALSDLEFLVVTWRVRLTNADWLDQGRSLVGETCVDWLDGFFLVLRSTFSEGPPAATSVVGRNEDLGLWAGTGGKGAKADERVVLNAILETAPALARARENTQIVIADRAHYGCEFEAGLHAAPPTPRR